MKPGTSDNSIVDASRLLRGLIDRGSFGHATTKIEVVETHISWVLLTGEYAYKIKKPVNLGFLDFSTLQARHKFCLLELELNHRFAPELYLDVVSIGGQPEQPAVGALPALEWAVRMRQFPSDARLDRQIEQGLISIEDMWAFGASLANLHDQSPVSGMDNGSFGTIGAVSRPVEDNFNVLKAHCAEKKVLERLDRLADFCERALCRLATTINERRSAGRIRECHGDLHLENLVRLDDRIVPFDCIEFDAGLRRIDVINEVAFLFMDTWRIERLDLGYSFLNRYLEISGDYPGMVMLPFYCVYRSLVRAKVAVLRDAQNTSEEARFNETPAEVLRYIDLAKRLANPKHQPCLIICRGLSGSGKTHLSRQLLPVVPAIRIRSDLIRKQLHDIGELETSGSAVGAGLYDPGITSRTYETLAGFSRIALNAGFHVIVDATFLRRSDREALRAVAKECTARFTILDCIADDRTLTMRIEKRLAERSDASEADLAVLDWQRANEEPLSDGERRQTITVDTGQKQRSIDEIARQLLKIAL